MINNRCESCSLPSRCLSLTWHSVTNCSIYTWWIDSPLAHQLPGIWFLKASFFPFLSLTEYLYIHLPCWLWSQHYWPGPTPSPPPTSEDWAKSKILALGPERPSLKLRIPKYLFFEMSFSIRLIQMFESQAEFQLPAPEQTCWACIITAASFICYQNMDFFFFGCYFSTVK